MKNLLKKLKNEVEIQSNELIKQIYANKKQLFKEIESYYKNLNRNGSIAESIPVYEKDEETIIHLVKIGLMLQMLHY